MDATLIGMTDMHDPHFGIISRQMLAQDASPPYCTRCGWAFAHHPECGPGYVRPEPFRCECGNEHFISNGTTADCSFCAKRYEVKHA